MGSTLLLLTGGVGMKKLIGLFAVTLMLSIPGFSQRGGGQHNGGERGVGNGHIPARGPAPVRTPPSASPPARVAGPNRGSAPPSQENRRRTFRDQPGHPEAPHVHAENDRWVGHDTGHNDSHYHLDHPWEHWRFAGGIVQRHV